MRYMLLWVCLTFGLIFTACQEKDVFADSVNNLQVAVFKAVQVAPDGVNTRATDGGFEQGDQIGIYVVRRNSNNDQGTLKAAGNYADNKRYVIDRNGKLQPFSAEDQIFLSQSEVYDFYAYYPYDAAMTDPTNYEFRVSADQINKTDYTASDFMLAKSSGVNDGNITLAFERKMALVELYFKKESTYDVSQTKIKVQSRSVVNIGKNEVVTVDDYKTSVSMKLHAENEDYYIFRAIVPVQDLKGDYLFWFTINDKAVYYKGKSTTPLAEGKKSIYTLYMQHRIRAYQHALITGTVTGAEKEIFNHGESVHLHAIPDYNYNFAGWYESSNSNWEENLVKITDLPDYYFTATKSALYVAFFECKKQPIVVKAVTLGEDTEGGVVYDSGIGNQGHLYGVRAAVILDGFTFKGWYIDDELVSTELCYSFTVPDHPVTIEARFQRKLITVTLDCYPSKEVLAPYYDKPSKVTAKYGDDIKLYGLIFTDSPYTFDGFYENGIYLNRDYPYTFKATEDRHIELRYGLRIFGLGAGDGFGILSQPGYFTRSTNDKDSHPTFMNKGQKVRITGEAECQVYINECSTPVRIKDKKLSIKIGDRVVWENSDFEDFIFTAPENATYTFHYSMTVEGRLQEGERVGLTTTLTRMAWFVE